MSGDGDSLDSKLQATSQTINSQNIQLSGSDDHNSYPVYSRDVVITTKFIDDSIKGSNKVTSVIRLCLVLFLCSEAGLLFRLVY